MSWAALALALVTTVDPLEGRAVYEARVATEVVGAFRDAQRPAPVRDPGLSLAARALAERVAAGTLANGAISLALPGAISEAGGWDPAVRTLLLGSGSVEALIGSVRGQSGLTEDPDNVFGVGLAEGPTRKILLILVGERLAEVKPFPRAVDVGATVDLDALLKGRWSEPKVEVTDPKGQPTSPVESKADGQRIHAQLRFPEAGRYTVEVMGRSKEGPRVAALFQVTAGNVSAVVDDDDTPEPRDPIAKSEAVLARINRLRQRANVPPLEHDHTLDVVALDHAVDMSENHFFAHVSPTRGDLRARMESRYGYSRAGENLGEANGALAAARAIEASPAHLENILDSGYRRVGVALYPNQHAGGLITLLLVEVFATPTDDEPDPAGAVLTAINAFRAHRKLPPLARDADLDHAAHRHVARMIHADGPANASAAQDDALERVDMESVAVDSFIGATADDATRSQNIASREFNAIGIYAQVHDSPKLGPKKLWIGVVYAQVGSPH